MNNKRNVLFWLLVVVATIIGIIHASSLRFVTDDAFISFRYAKNLVKGLGLVYNMGERVEGFTNFLWTIIIALGMKFHLDPVPFSTTLGIFFFVAALVLYCLLSWKFRAFGKERLLFLPLTTIALSLHHDMSVYATGGLETSMFTFLVSAGFAAILLAKSERALVSAGMMFVLAMMTRPDGIVFLAASFVFVAITQKKPLRSCIFLLAPSVVIFLPYWFWRYSYYGYFFPNSFYAKSIDLPYYSQGFQYALLYFKTYYIFLLIIVLGIILLWRSKAKCVDVKSLSSFLNRYRESNGSAHPLLLGLLLASAYTLFIIRIGGDFMFSRFFIPITPILFFVMELLINAVTSQLPYLLLSLIICLTTFFRFDQFRESALVGYIADESQYYTEGHLQQSQVDGELLRKYFAGLPVKIGFWAGQVQLVYYADPAVAIETTTGLTDATIAHQEITTRGRPGHEKNALVSYLVERKINFYIGPMQSPTEGQLPLNAIVFDSILARIIIYDNTIMSQLAKYPEVKFVRFPEYLDSYITAIHSYPLDKVRQGYQFFKSFYFNHNQDPEREKAFVRLLGLKN